MVLWRPQKDFGAPENLVRSSTQLSKYVDNPWGGRLAFCGEEGQHVCSMVRTTCCCALGNRNPSVNWILHECPISTHSVHISNKVSCDNNSLMFSEICCGHYDASYCWATCRQEIKNSISSLSTSDISRCLQPKKFCLPQHASDSAGSTEICISHSRLLFLT